MCTPVQPSQTFLDLKLEFVWRRLSLYGEHPELILACKPIFMSNPTKLGKVMFWLELSWGCDNNRGLQSQRGEGGWRAKKLARL